MNLLRWTTDGIMVKNGSPLLVAQKGKSFMLFTHGAAMPAVSYQQGGQ